MSSPAFMDPKRLGGLVGQFSAAFVGTPESDDVVDRTRMALKELPDEAVRELRDVVDVLDTLTRERLGDSGEAPGHDGPDRGADRGAEPA